MTAMTVAGKPGVPLWADPDISTGKGMTFGKALAIAAVIEVAFISAVFMFPPTGKHIAEKEQIMEVVDVVEEEPPPPPEPEKIVEEKPKEVEKILEKVQEAPKPQSQPEQAPIPMEAPKPVDTPATSTGGMSVPTAVGESKPAVGNPTPDAKPAPVNSGPVKGLAPKSKVGIEYPRKARENDVQGLVIAWAHIDGNGDVTDVEIKKSPPGGSALANEVKRKLMQWKFHADGQAHTGVYEVNFTLSGEEEEIVDVN
ncbi:TonB family protein [Chitinivorax tropicus]|uniref:TonB family protein n=1 Tax=Chitinivorax tropicus TaxID=714531 RepID=A0A840MY85_9PROT|nr:TonB family protein [Chitinivorax tropicus]MBB5020111.1 TonB family protein [Chitinivorax tropicus]